MRSARWFILALVALLLVMPACSGGDDDDADNNGTSDESDATQRSNNDDDGDDGNENDDSDAEIPQIKAGVYPSARLHIEVTGDEDVELYMEGNGFAQEGFALFTYQNTEATVQIPLSNEDGTPGAISLTTAEISTAGEWGRDCTLNFEQSGDKVTGEFSCDELDALEPGTTRESEVGLKGTFTAGQ